MKLFIVAALLAIVPSSTYANDSSFEGVGGSMRPTRGENKAIRMVQEKVVLSAHSKDYATQADFVFSNETGRAQKVAMGFPEGNFGDVDDRRVSKKTGFRGFKTFVDGQSVAASRVILHEMDESGFDTYWVKTVIFAPHQTRRVRVMFSSPYGGTVNWGLTRALSYTFTGKNWRGKVGESVMEVRVSEPGLWRGTALANNGKPLSFQVQSSPREATFRRVWKNWEAQDGVVFGLEKATAFWREDVTGADFDSLTVALVNAAQTVRIGEKPTFVEEAQGMPTDGFTYNGIFYVGVSHLANTLAGWAEGQKPKIESQLNFSPATGFDLRAGKTRIQGKEGDRVVRINGQTIATGGPLLSVTNGGMRSLYVPLATVARSLGWKAMMKGERLFTLERGNWKG